MFFPRAEHQEEREHPLDKMNPNQDGIEGSLIAEPEAGKESDNEQ